MIFTGQKLSGEEALQIGLVNHVESDFDTAVEKALGLANQIGEKGPIAIKAAKLAINYGMNMDLKSALLWEEACYAKTLHTEDRLEGLKAFAEKRKPKY